MFEKLLSLLLHARSGAVATVLVLGASGALVTATVENGTATIKITPGQGAAEAAVAPVTATTVSNTTSTNTTVDPAILALFTRTKAEDDPTSPATGGNGCSDAAKAINEQVKRVNDAFNTDQQAIEKMGKDARTDAAKKAVSDAEKAIKDIRQAAVKAIHATNASATCKTDDEDVNEQQGDNNDKNDASDTNDQNNNDVNNEQEGEHDDDNGTTPPTGAAPTTTAPTTPSVVFSGDAKAIADAAISALALWVTDVKAAIAAQPAATTTTNATKAKTDNKSNRTNTTKQSSKGKGGHEGDD